MDYDNDDDYDGDDAIIAAIVLVMIVPSAIVSMRS